MDGCPRPESHPYIRFESVGVGQRGSGNLNGNDPLAQSGGCEQNGRGDEDSEGKRTTNGEAEMHALSCRTAEQSK